MKPDLNVYLDERATLELAHGGASIARFGDGEFKLCMGRAAVSQRAEPGLVLRLKTVLLNADRNAIVCLPRPNPSSPKFELWKTFDRSPYRELIRPNVTYGSAFITRPDSAPWIDSPDYWDRVADLWRDRDVVLIRGSSKSLTAGELKEAKSVREVIAPRQHAFSEFDALFRALRREERRVLLCLGATATVLAYFLGGEGVHALDLGHVGMFMRRKGRL